MTLHVAILPVLHNNYTYVIARAGQAVVVDPGEAEPVLAYLQEHNLRITHVLNTHHHSDHIAGNALCLAEGGTLVAPGAETRIPHTVHPVADGDTFELLGETVQCLATPGHTHHHLVYMFTQSRLLFAGDALFSLGCGRCFEGTPAQMWAGLQKLRTLPDDTQVYCGHEYTHTNARFLLSIWPDHTGLQEKAAWIEALAPGRPTLPARLGDEKALNMFLRCDDPELAHVLGIRGTPADVFTHLRSLRNTF